MSLLQSALSKIRGENTAPVPASSTSASPEADRSTTPPSSEEREMTQRFAQFVMMQAQQVMMMLGLTPSPYGQMPAQLEEAKLFIDQLEMIAVKTQGNLGRQETALLAKVLDQCTLAFTKVSGGTPPSLMPGRSIPEIPLDEIVGPLKDEATTSKKSPSASTAPQSPSAPPRPASAEPATPPSDPADNKKKFSKSYGSF